MGTLLAGVLIGQLDIKVPSMVKTIFFDLFLFTTGYKVGPQFFRGLKQRCSSPGGVDARLCVACLVTAFVFSKLLGYDTGTAAGLLAGAFSESTVIGTAGEAIGRLSIPDAEKTAMMNSIPVAYAVTYLIGTASLVWFIPTIGPKLMGINLREEGAGSRPNGTPPRWSQASSLVRGSSMFAPTGSRTPTWFNKSIAELEALRGTPASSSRGSAVAARSSKPLPGSVIRKDDVVAVLARQEMHVRGRDAVGPEVEDKALLDIPIETLDVVVTRTAMDGKTLAELATT